MSDNPFTIRDGWVWWGRCWLPPSACARLLRAYAAEPATFPGRAEQLRAAMAEAYPETRKAA